MANLTKEKVLKPFREVEIGEQIKFINGSPFIYTRIKEDSYCECCGHPQTLSYDGGKASTSEGWNGLVEVVKAKKVTKKKKEQQSLW